MRESASTVDSPRPSAAMAGWPAYVFVLLVLGAALYAFSPRPIPPFPPTRLQPDQMLVTGLAQQGDRSIAVGEQGHIFYRDGASADAAQATWQEATITPARGSTLTQVAFVGKDTVIAVGHDAWIVRSTDGGKTWTEAAYDPQLAQPLFGISGPYNGTLYAYGAFGLLMTSTDLGKTWTKIPFDIKTAEAANAPPKPVDPNADPFANYSSAGSDLANHHLYGLTQLDDGSLLLVGERGLLARSTDGGHNWISLPSIYKGSFFGVLKPSAHSVLAFGMRGHAFISQDDGKTWQPSVIPKVLSLFGGTVLADGRIVLVGEQDSVLVSSDGGAHFALDAIADSGTLDAVLPGSGDTLLAAGIHGLHAVTLSAGAHP